MDVSYNWLKTLVEIPVSIEEYEKQMILAGFEIEGVNKFITNIKNVVVGKIDSITQHPNADKLKICMIDVGEEERLQIVTGADNVFEGAIIPVALVGAELPDGTVIKKGKLRGETSLGMLCGGSELEFDKMGIKNAEVDGILILEGDFTIGEDIITALGLDDDIIDFSITANRSDCMSMNGIAMESAAVLNSKFNIELLDTTKGEGKDELKVIVEDTDLCPRYMAAVIDNIKIGESPDWMKKRLLSSGIRPINNMVDITNYVMVEYGQPMHAFDYDAVEDHTIIVRRAGSDKEIVTLDGKKRELTSDMLLITDPKKPIGVAGVMGAQNSQVEPSTKKVILESALFNGANIRRTSQKLGLPSDAASKFSKGISPMTPFYAYNRALQLITELDVGEVKDCFIDVVNVDLAEKHVKVDAQKINKRTALTLTPEKMAELLQRLQIKTQINGDELDCTIPYFRLDIEQMADVSEEVARIYGYHNIPSQMLSGVASGSLGEKKTREEDVRKIMMGKGFHEILTYSFFSRKVFDKLELEQEDCRREVVAIQNPLGEDQSVMRTTMADSTLNVLSLNSRRNIDKLSVYEFGKVYLPQKGEKLPYENQRLVFGMYGKDIDFYTIKGHVESILKYFGIKDIQIDTKASSFLHSGRRCSLIINDRLLGEIGEVSSSVLETYEIDKRAYYADLDFDYIIELENMVKIYKPIPRFPAVYRDLAVVVGKDILAGDLIAEIYKVKNVCDVKVFDVYEGKQVGEGKKSIAFPIVFRADDRTLNDKEIDQKFDKIVKNLKEKFNAELR